ncbi:MAG TPA: low affinity iron permease family protein [Pirellulaceae bacterium]|jgi:low affinity Fe/Cu permease
MISTAEKISSQPNAKSNGNSNGKLTGLRALNEPLERFSRRVTIWSGSSWAFTLAVAVVIVWAVTGPIFHYSDTWQLVINTGTTIVTFLMVFLIQRAQNKDSLAIQIKLNELLASQQGASNRLINLEDWNEDDIIALHQRFAKLSERLDHAASGCEAHSIAEAKDAVDEAQDALTDAHNLVARGK